MAIIEGVRNGKFRITIPINTKKLFTARELLLTVDNMEMIVKAYHACADYLKPLLKERR